MSNKRFKETISTGIVTDTLTGKEYKCEMRIDDDFLELVNTISAENEQLKKQINDITIKYTENRIEFDKDELYVRDNNIEIDLKNRNLSIIICVPSIKEYLKLHYTVTGKSFEREYEYFKKELQE